MDMTAIEVLAKNYPGTGRYENQFSTFQEKVKRIIVLRWEDSDLAVIWLCNLFSLYQEGKRVA